MIRRGAAVIASVLLLLCTSACSKGGTAAAVDTHNLRIAVNITPTQLNPILAQNTIESFIDGLMFDELVTLNAKHQEVPDLAAVVPTRANGGISRNGLTITYHLRHGVTWSDGAPFTSRDVKFTWQAIMNPANNVVTRHGYDDIASIDTPDPYTVVLHMKRRFAPAVDTIFGESDSPYRILPAHLLARYPNLNHIPFNANPVGTGPFTFVRWMRGDRIILRANPHYFRGVPKLRTLTLLIIPDDNTVQAQMLAHDVDLAIEIDAPAYANLSRAPGIVGQLVDTPVYTSLAFNTARAPLDDVRVRRALVLGLNRALITRDLSHGTATPAVADLSPFYWAYDARLRPVPYDLARAKAMLDADGWKVGPDGIRTKDGRQLALQLAYGQGSQLSRALAEQAQQMYRALGVALQLKSYDYALYYADAESGGILNGGKFDIAVYAWVSGGDPDNSSQWLCSERPPNGNNITRYCSAQMDALQHRALRTFDRAKRAVLYHRIERLLLRDAPMAFVYYQRLRYAKVAALKHFTPNGISEGWNAQDWSL